MRNRLFVPNFLFDFFANRGSIGTPSAHSNVSKRAGLENSVSQKTGSAGLSCAGQRLAANGSTDTSWAGD